MSMKYNLKKYKVPEENKNSRIITKDLDGNIKAISGYSFLEEWFYNKYTIEDIKKYLDSDKEKLYQKLFGNDLKALLNGDNLSLEDLKLLQEYNAILRDKLAKKEEIKQENENIEHIDVSLPKSLKQEFLLTDMEVLLSQRFLFRHQYKTYITLQKLYGDDWQRSLTQEEFNKFSKDKELEKKLNNLLDLLKEFYFKEEVYYQFYGEEMPLEIGLKIIGKDYQWVYNGKTLDQILECSKEKLKWLREIIKISKPSIYTYIQEMFGEDWTNPYTLTNSNFNLSYFYVYLKGLLNIKNYLDNIPFVLSDNVDNALVTKLITNYNLLNKRQSVRAIKRKNTSTFENKSLTEILNCTKEDIEILKLYCLNYPLIYHNISLVFGLNWDKKIIYLENNREECGLFIKYNLRYLQKLLENLKEGIYPSIEDTLKEKIDVLPENLKEIFISWLSNPQDLESLAKSLGLSLAEVKSKWNEALNILKNTKDNEEVLYLKRGL